MEDNENSFTELPDPHKNSPKNIPISKMIEYRNKGLSYSAIAKLLDCTKANVVIRLRDYQDEIDNIDSFKQHRADTLAVHQSKLLNTLTPSKVSDMSGHSIVQSVATLYNLERLERGQSTDNIAVEALVESKTSAEEEYKEALAKRQEVQRRLQLARAGIDPDQEPEE